MGNNLFIRESGMDFQAENAFYIEKSKSYIRVKDKEIKSVEFVRYKNDSLYFVEAKTSFPNPSKSAESFEDQAEIIVEKFTHSLSLYSSILLGVNAEDASELIELGEDGCKVALLLVIKTHKDEWCSSVQKILQTLLNECGYVSKIWQPKVYVVNESGARKFGFVV